MNNTIKAAGYYFCGTCGALKSAGDISDCVNCTEKIKERMRIEFNQEL